MLQLSDIALRLIPKPVGAPCPLVYPAIAAQPLEQVLWPHAEVLGGVRDCKRSMGLGNPSQCIDVNLHFLILFGLVGGKAESVAHCFGDCEPAAALQFFEFLHPDAASAYSVFEVVNTRGRELTTANLLKSYVLSY